MTYHNEIFHAHRVGHEHQHAHEHAHTTRPRLNPYGILASEIAQHPVENWLTDLEVRSQALGLYKFLFPFSARRSTKDGASSHQPNVSTANMDVLWTVVQQQEGKEQVSLDTVFAEARRIAPGLDQENLLDYADQLLLAASDEKLVKQGREIERAGGNGGDKASRTGSITGQMSRLNAIHKIYTSLLEAIQLKLRLIEYVANYPKDYLGDGRQELLKPLTKARIVRALGFESSGGRRRSRVRSQREKELMNTGRRLERYMKHLWILLSDGPPHRP